MTYLPGMEAIKSDVMDQVVAAAKAYDYDKYTAADVRRALAHDNRTPEDFAALLSPAALPLLEEIAQAAQKETRKHFGNSVYMFTPIYIANYCENYCIYCGFNCHNKINRAQLNAEELDKEMAAIANTGPIKCTPRLPAYLLRYAPISPFSEVGPRIIIYTRHVSVIESVIRNLRI